MFREENVCCLDYIYVMLTCRQGLGRHGNEYGPLQEIPDWSYAGQHQSDYRRVKVMVLDYIILMFFVTDVFAHLSYKLFLSGWVEIKCVNYIL